MLKINGTYRTVDTPSQTDLDSATEVYLGGHVYAVTQAVADALNAAGYTTVVDASVDTIWSELLPRTWGEVAGAPWNNIGV